MGRAVAFWVLSLLLTAGCPSLLAASPNGSTLANYDLHCQGCHGRDGRGMPSAGVPDFNNAIASFAETETGRIYVFQVPGVVGSGLDNQQLADVINYIMRRWGGHSLQMNFRPFTAAEVKRLRQVHVDDVVKYRRKVVKVLREKGLPVAAYPWP